MTAKGSNVDASGPVSQVWHLRSRDLNGNTCHARRVRCVVAGGTGTRRKMGAADYMQFRPLMFSIAYRMTGSVSDAEDIVQEAFLRLTRALRDGAQVTSPKAYLATVTTRLAISHLRSARVRREAYVGAWLPEPIVEGGLAPATAPDPAERAEMSDSLSMAFLVLLESLTPTERAVFLLHEVFSYDYAEIAEITGKSEPNCRQIFARARHHIDEGKPRFEASREQRDEVARRFFDAVDGGDLGSLLELLAPDVVMVGDGGGKGRASREPTHGAERVARFLLGLFRRAHKEGTYGVPALVNGQPGAVAYDAEGRVASVFALDIADGLVQAVRSVVNPDKLQHLGPTSERYLRGVPGGPPPLGQHSPDRDLPWRSWPLTSPRRARPTRSWRASPPPRTRGCASC
jgi:RNA polymerase sigma-70 factor (ECF subfamily)